MWLDNGTIARHESPYKVIREKMSCRGIHSLPVSLPLPLPPPLCFSPPLNHSLPLDFFSYGSATGPASLRMKLRKLRIKEEQKRLRQMDNVDGF